VGVHKVGNFGAKSEGKIRFLAPEKPGTFVYNIHLVCDGYLGCDKMKTTKLTVITDEQAKKLQAQKQQQLQLQQQTTTNKDEIKEDSDGSDLSDDDSLGSESD